MKNNKTFYQSQTFEWFRLKSALHIWIYNYEVIPHGHSDPPQSPSPRLNHGSRQAGRLPGRDWELLSWGSKKQQKESLWGHNFYIFYFLYILLLTYIIQEKPWETLRTSDLLCAFLAWVANRESYKTWHRNGLAALTALRATGVVKPGRHLTVLKC